MIEAIYGMLLLTIYVVGVYILVNGMPRNKMTNKNTIVDNECDDDLIED